MSFSPATFTLDGSGVWQDQDAQATITVPAGTASGNYKVALTAHAGTATGSSQLSVNVSQSKTLYTFEDGTAQGWQPGANVSSVAAVTSFANGPQTPYAGNYALDATCTSAPASDWHTISVSPGSPLDLSSAKTFSVYEDSYGGVPDASGYEAMVTLTAADGQTLSKTFPTSSDTWNPLNLDVSSWPDRSQVSQIVGVVPRGRQHHSVGLSIPDRQRGMDGMRATTMKLLTLTAAAFALVLAIATAGSSAAAHSGAATSGSDSGLLGLPSTSTAQRYVLAPASRTVQPQGAIESTTPNDDFVTPGSSTSESAHGLDAGTSSTQQTDGVTVRDAGTGAAGYFSYLLHVPSGHQLTIRVEEAGSATSDYWVLINGTRVYHRTPDPRQSGSWDGLNGLVHYEFTVGTNQARANAPAPGELKITFQNSDSPGDGARIAGVWANDAGSQPQQPYGGTVSNASGATSSSGMTLSANDYGRPYVIFDFGHEVGGQVQMTMSGASGSPRLGLAFSEASMYMTSASDFSEDSPGVATETHYVDVPSGTTQFTDPVIRGGFRYLMVFLDSPGSVNISDLRLHFTPDPTATDLRSYPGAFLSASDQLNQLWYSGAYTVQMDTIDPTTGRPYPATPGPVQNNATIASGPTAITDGAKRDRMDWVGDQSVEDPVAYLTTDRPQAELDSFEFMGQGAASDGEVPGDLPALLRLQLRLGRVRRLVDLQLLRLLPLHGRSRVPRQVVRDDAARRRLVRVAGRSRRAAERPRLGERPLGLRKLGRGDLRQRAVRLGPAGGGQSGRRRGRQRLCHPVPRRRPAHRVGDQRQAVGLERGRLRGRPGQRSPSRRTAT